MRRIERTGQFRRDFKREARGAHRKTLETDFVAVVKVLADDETLDARHRDHGLTGPWQDHRNCHLRPDLVLIYSKPDDARANRGQVGRFFILGISGAGRGCRAGKHTSLLAIAEEHGACS